VTEEKKGKLHKAVTILLLVGGSLVGAIDVARVARAQLLGGAGTVVAARR
jgi:hypothetical protein